MAEASFPFPYLQIAPFHRLHIHLIGQRTTSHMDLDRGHTHIGLAASMGHSRLVRIVTGLDQDSHFVPFEHYCNILLVIP
mmetsp:Transcript_2770/g.2409  ORF Transcript_2770/g.2409 Transcript_2770/m.2409 type:complete len:80 (-) Transcript_2770:287-526(-)